MMAPENHDQLIAALGRVKDVVLPLPNILGSAYGARWTDRGLRMMRLLDPLFGRFGPENEDWVKMPDVIAARDAPRAEAGEPSLDFELSMRPLLPLTRSEHVALGLRLKRMQRNIVRAQRIIGSSHRKGSWEVTSIAAIERPLLRLRAALEVIGRCGNDVYFGRPPEEK